MNSVQRFVAALLLAVLCGSAVLGAVENGSATQVSGSTDVLAGLVTQGLRAASSNPPLNLGTGTLTAGSAVSPGYTSASAAAITMNPGDSAGSNTAGAAYTERAGLATGNAATGDWIVKSGFVLASSSTVQTAYDRDRIPGKTTTLSTTTATATSLISMSTLTGAGGAIGGCLRGVIDVEDATPHVAAIYFEMLWSASNQAGTPVVGTAVTRVVVSSVATFTALTTTVTSVVSGTAILLKVTPSWSAGTPTSVRATWRCESYGPTTGTVQ